LSARGYIHFGDACNREVKKMAADLLNRDREEALSLGLQPPGQAEYLDMLRAVSRIGHDEDVQISALKAIFKFALSKHPREH